MATNYPSGLDAFTNPLADDPLTSPPHHSQHADVNDAVEAIELELGTDPAGVHADVKTRLDAVDTSISLIESTAATHDHVGGDGAQIDHGGLAGLSDDDHAQYLNATRHAAVDAADHGSGSAGDRFVLTADGAGGAAWAPPEVVYADNGDAAGVAVNSVTDVTVKSATVTGVAAGDAVMAELTGTLFNNSGASRSFTLTPDFDGAFLPAQAITMDASPTAKAPVRVTWQLSVRSAATADMFAQLVSPTTSVPQGGGAFGFQSVRAMWGTVSADLTGSVDVTLKVRSSATLPDQLFLVHSFVVRKIPST